LTSLRAKQTHGWLPNILHVGNQHQSGKNASLHITVISRFCLFSFLVPPRELSEGIGGGNTP
jgi:hypothetical protein